MLALRQSAGGAAARLRARLRDALWTALRTRGLESRAGPQRGLCRVRSPAGFRRHSALRGTHLRLHCGGTRRDGPASPAPHFARARPAVRALSDGRVPRQLFGKRGRRPAVSGLRAG
ncbi:ORFL129C [Human betaherpesvirus 5]|nr:ORFL129C [Human betaherpesvirus 5]QHX40451.1 ORFL129C [Human betaherpesvirus 5]